MNKIIFILVVILSCLYAKAQTSNVGFTYDADGNLILRKIIVVGPSNAKPGSNQEEKVDEEIGEQKIIVYPNPTNGIVKLEILEVDGQLNNYCRIYSLNGALLINKKISGSLTEIDLSIYETGSYLMDIHLGEKTSRWKIIKE